MRRLLRRKMQAQKDRARKARGGEGYMGAAVTVYDELPTDLETKFAGYDVDTVVDAKSLLWLQTMPLQMAHRQRIPLWYSLTELPSTQKAAVRLVTMVSSKPQTAWLR